MFSVPVTYVLRHMPHISERDIVTNLQTLYKSMKITITKRDRIEQPHNNTTHNHYKTPPNNNCEYHIHQYAHRHLLTHR